MSQPRRNEACPCGSGKRFKHCCGREEARAAAEPVELGAGAAERALQAFNEGRYERAEKLYQGVLQDEPANADALHVLGVIANRRGDGVRGQELIERAIDIDSGKSVYFLNLGTAFLEQGKLERAEASYRKALAMRPDLAEARTNLAFALNEQGRHRDALAELELAVEQRPDFAEAHYNLAHTLQVLERTEEALGHYHRALDCNPDYPEACLNLGSIYLGQERQREALEWLDKAAALRPGYADAHYNRAKALHALGRTAEACSAYRKAIELQPDHANALHDLGVLYKDEKNLDAARACFEREIALKPADAEAHFSLSTIWYADGAYERAEQCLRQALALDPDYAVAHMHFGGVYMAQGRMEEAEASYRRATQLDPDDAVAQSNLLLALQYASHVSVHEIFQDHRRVGERLEADFASYAPHGNVRDPGKRIRIAYLSPDFRQHSVAYFAETVIARHDRERFEVFGYYSHNIEDEVTARFRRYCDHWRNVDKLADDRVADLIREDGIDILVDLAGHTGRNRLPVFARKPAPVQVTWLGHPNTTGMKAMDYRITDAFAEPEGMTEHLNAETLWRLPEIFCCYTPCASKPERLGSAELEPKPTPALDKGYVTFGSFNNIAKLSPPVVALWARVLHAVPGSRLMLEAHMLDKPLMQDQIRSRFAAHGIGPERLILLPRKQEQQYVLYHEIDIALDPFPCVGGATSFDSLWMGVPLVTLAGRSFVSRMGVSLLSNLGLDELVAADEDAYVEIAAALAHDLERLKGIRQGMRKRMEASPLMDAERFARHMEAAYREMWRRWCGADNAGTN